jgi:hypothetical protein
MNLHRLMTDRRLFAPEGSPAPGVSVVPGTEVRPADPATAAPAPTPTPTPTPAPSLASEPAADPAKPADDKPAEPRAETKPADAPAAFYPTKFKAPEGFTADEAGITAFAETFNDPALAPQDRAEKLLSMHAEALKAAGAANVKAFTEMQENWLKEIKADPEIGGDKLNETKTMISRAIDSLGPERATAFRQALDATGAGNNPAIVRGLRELSRALAEGTAVVGAPPSGKDKSLGAMFFPNSPDMQPKG